MGMLAARYVAGRLLPSRCRIHRRIHLGDGGEDESEGEAALEAGPERLRPALPWERCYGADSLPVRRFDGVHLTPGSTSSAGVDEGKGWHLVDEGGGKGVVKLGLVSHAVGEVLELGPVAHPPGGAHGCTAVAASIGHVGGRPLLGRAGTLYSGRRALFTGTSPPVRPDRAPFRSSAPAAASV